MKRRLFIGSSKEGLSIAQNVKKRIEAEFGSWISPEIWNEEGIFKLNNNTLDTLAQKARSSEYGILIATSDDWVVSRKLLKKGIRDNVLLELGMFVGSLGLSRAFVLVESKVKLPSDYSGISIPFFERKNPKSLDEAISSILNLISATENSVGLTPSASAALAVGYYQNFILPAVSGLMSQDSDSVIEILIPEKLYNLNSSIQSFLLDNPSTDFSVNGNGRPFIKKYNDAKSRYWDVPTTLTTLEKVSDIFVHQKEFGINKEKESWIEYEIRNFIQTINLEVSKDRQLKDRVIIKRF